VQQRDPSLADRQGPDADLRRLERRPAGESAIVHAAGGIVEPAATERQVLVRLCSTSLARLGWVFRDHWQFARAFEKPEPPPVVVSPSLSRSVRLADARLKDLPAISGAVLLVGGAFAESAAMGVRGALAQVQAAAPVLAPFLGGVLLWGGFAGGSWWLRHQRLDRAENLARQMDSSTRQSWEAEEAAFYTSEVDRLKDIPEWGPVTVTGKDRVDIFGGDLRSWSGVLTTFLTSVAHPEYAAVALDLTASEVVQEAAHLCGLAGRAVDRTMLPEDMEQLLEGLDARDVTNLVIDLVHGTGNVDRAEERVVDTRLLRGLCAALEPDVTLPRLQHALQETLGESPRESLLTDSESRRIGSGLFGGDFVQQSHDRLRVLEAYVSQLVEAEALGVDEAGREGAPETGQQGEGRVPDLHCVMLGRRARAASDLLANLAVQWATREVERRQIKTLVVAGADRVPLLLLELLSRRCQERGTQLVAMFEHLRDDVTRFLGGGRMVGFMRLGNHTEAEVAANFIGRGHRFVLSQVTKGYGGQSSENFGTNQGQSTSDAETMTMRRPFLGLVWREARDHRLGRERSRTQTFGTNWGSSLQYTEGTNWNVAESSNRVYEYRVEPTQLQNLPEYTMLLVVSEPGGPRIMSLECCPDIATLPHVSHVPFDQLELPAADAAAGVPRLPAPRGES
jgi:hypothetical protein